MLTAIDDELASRVLSSKPRCRRLNVANNAISAVIPSASARLSSLVALDLSGNRLTRLEIAAFAPLVNLQVFNAAHNLM